MSESILKKIRELKKRRKAVILAHNYQLPEVQDIADYVGDSLELARIASRTDAAVIVLCGVRFMAETASILCPDRKVLMPDINAGCPMADMIDEKRLRAFRKKHPGSVVVAYVNTSASVKAESDICCTSANAVRVVRSLDKGKEIIFIPDKYLGGYVMKKTGRKMILWHGYCPVHLKILPEDVMKQKKKHPRAEILVHPECSPPVIDLADKVLSTGGMLKYAKKSKAREFIIGTETGIIHKLEKENPAKEFYPASSLAVCRNMKLISLENILWCLEEMKEEVKVDIKTRLRAVRAVQRMLGKEG